MFAVPQATTACDQGVVNCSRRCRLTVTLLETAIGSSTPATCSSDALFALRHLPGTASRWRTPYLRVIRSRKASKFGFQKLSSMHALHGDVSSSQMSVGGVQTTSACSPCAEGLEGLFLRVKTDKLQADSCAATDDRRSYRMILMRLRHRRTAARLWRYAPAKARSVVYFDTQHTSLQCISWKNVLARDTIEDMTLCAFPELRNRTMLGKSAEESGRELLEEVESKVGTATAVRRKGKGRGHSLGSALLDVSLLLILATAIWTPTTYHGQRPIHY